MVHVLELLHLENFSIHYWHVINLQYTVVWDFAKAWHGVKSSHKFIIGLACFFFFFKCSSLLVCNKNNPLEPFKCYVTLFSWKLDPHPTPRNANNIEHYTFTTLFFWKIGPHPHLRYVTLEWLHFTENEFFCWGLITVNVTVSVSSILEDTPIGSVRVANVSTCKST